MPILDSGDRTHFETGAVRDMRTDKGRCDLMPLDEVATSLAGLGGEESEIYLEGYGQVSKASALHRIAQFQKDGNRADLHEALDIFSALAYGGSLETMFLDVSHHFKEGCEKYGENNWQKGIPVYCYIDSAVRHYLKWSRGDKDERHDRAFVWNIMCAAWTCEHKPELNAYGKEE